MENKFEKYNRQGLIPGPLESAEEFLQRAEFCLDIKSRLAPEISLVDTAVFFKPAFEKTARFYSIEPDWVPLIFDNHKLSIWHGGCAWIFQLEEGGPLSALMQLRKSLKSNSPRGLARSTEVIAHEMAHVGRMAFEEPKFEELLAYRSSPSPWRAYFGPIAQNSKETGIFVLSLIMIVMLDLFFVFSDQGGGLYLPIQALKLFPLLFVALGLVRLGLRQRKLNSCLKNIEKVARNPDQALAIAYRLTDREIELFATLGGTEILAYFQKLRASSPRLELIASLYL